MGLDASRFQQEFEQMIPFIKRNGMEIVEIEKGYVKMRAQFDGNQNHFAVMYAGALFTLGELPAGAIYLSTFDTDRLFPLVKDMSIKFLAPTKTDAFIEVRIPLDRSEAIEKEAEQNGKADFGLEAEIKDADGTVTAICKGSYQLRKRSSDVYFFWEH